MTPTFLAPHSPWPGGIYSWFSRLDAPSRKGAYFEVLERNRVFWLLQSDVAASLFQQLSALHLSPFCPGLCLPPLCSSLRPFLSHLPYFPFAPYTGSHTLSSSPSVFTASGTPTHPPPPLPFCLSFCLSSFLPFFETRSLYILLATLDLSI